MGKTNYQTANQIWFSSAFSQSPTIPPTEDRGLWLRDWEMLIPAILVLQIRHFRWLQIATLDA